MIMVSANETFKKILNPTGEMNVTAYVASGAMAGALVRFCNPHLDSIMSVMLTLRRFSIAKAGALTNPLDVAKTRLQTQMLLVPQEDASVRVATASFGSPTAELQVFMPFMRYLNSIFAYHVA